MAADEEPIASGSLGDNLTYVVRKEGEETVLTISGSGEMTQSPNSTLTEEVREAVTKAVIEIGVTSIPDIGFEYFSNMRTIEIPVTVTKIGNWAFAYSALEEVILPECILETGSYIFGDCHSLKKVNQEFQL